MNALEAGSGRTERVSAAVRPARAEDIPALQRLDPWPKEHLWRQKITNSEVMVLTFDGSVIGVMRALHRAVDDGAVSGPD